MKPENISENLDFEIKSHIATIWLNRPEVRNALNEKLVSELIQLFKSIAKNNDIYVVVLRGRGKVFCAGADIQWMKNSGSQDIVKNKSGTELLAQCFHFFYKIPQPTIVLVHGATMGGALGFIGAADISICTNNTQFSLSETRIGLAPALIMPYLLSRVNEHKVLDLAFTGKKINVKHALEIGLVDCIVENISDNEKLNQLTSEILKASPSALLETKRLQRSLKPSVDKKIIFETIKSISKMKQSHDGQEGMKAFIEKRLPQWNKLKF